MGNKPHSESIQATASAAQQHAGALDNIDKAVRIAGASNGALDAVALNAQYADTQYHAPHAHEYHKSHLGTMTPPAKHLGAKPEHKSNEKTGGR